MHPTQLPRRGPGGPALRTPARLLAATVLGAVPAAQGALGEAKLLPADAEPFQELGTSVAVSGERALVGGWGGFFDAATGAAYVFRRTPAGWVEEAKLEPADPVPFDQFGYAVALSGGRALVGAWGDGISTPGAAYLFERTPAGWVERAKLTPSDGEPGDRFGRSVALSGGRALVGAYLEGEGGEAAGAAYVFEETPVGWVERAKLVATDAAAGDELGWSVALAGDRALVGAPLANPTGAPTGVAAGAAYVFRATASGWTQEAKLVAADAWGGDRFGASVALSGGRALVGAPADDDGGIDAGAAYAFALTPAGWSEEAKLLADDGATGDAFGEAVALAGDRAAVGAFLDDDAGAGSGAAYAFERAASGWTQRAKLTPSDAAPGAGFGVSVAVARAHLVVGAAFADAQGTSSGTAYAYGTTPAASPAPPGAR